MKVEKPAVSFEWRRGQGALQSDLWITFPREVEIDTGVIDVELAANIPFVPAQQQPELVYFMLAETYVEYSVVVIEDGAGSRKGAGKRTLICFRTKGTIKARKMYMSWKSSVAMPGLVLNQLAAQLIGPCTSQIDDGTCL